MLHSDRRCLQNAVRNILDGELLNKYLYLSTMERSELAKKIGTTQDIVSTQRQRRGCSEVGPCTLMSLSFYPPFISRSWMTSWRWTESQLTSESHIPTSRPLNALFIPKREMFFSLCKPDLFFLLVG